MAGAVEGSVVLEGFKDLQKSMRRMAGELPALFRGTLLELAEPVRRSAELKTGEEIRNILSPTAEVDWWRMRTGVTMREVYVAPQQHGTHQISKKRPNLA